MATTKTKKNNSTKTASNKSKSTSKNSRKNTRKKQQHNEFFAVLTMFLGLVLLVSAFVVYFNRFDELTTNMEWFTTILAFVSNIVISAAIVLAGIVMFTKKELKFSGWTLVGIFMFFGGILGFLHLPVLVEHFDTAKGIGEAFSLGLHGVGGGLFGFFVALTVAWLKPMIIGKVILVALILLGLLLGTEFKVLHIFSYIKNKIEDMRIRDEEEEEENRKKSPKTKEEPAKTGVLNENLIEEQPKRKGRKKVETPIVTEAPEFDLEKEAEPEPSYLQGIMPKVTQHDDLVVNDIEEMPTEGGSQLHWVGKEEKAENTSINSGNSVSSNNDYSQYFGDLIKEDGNTALTNGNYDYSKDNIANDLANDFNNDNLGEKTSVKDISYQERINTQPQELLQRAQQELIEAQKAGKLPNQSANAGGLGFENAGVNPPLKEGEIRLIKKPYVLPPLSLLAPTTRDKNSSSNQELMENSKRLENALDSFGVKAKVVEVVSGPSVIRYELQPAPGVKVSKIVNLADDIALTLAARGLRIEAPVPGKSVIGIEIAKDKISTVNFKDVIASQKFRESKSKITIGLGIDISGTPIVADLATMPHLLIAGSTGSGKSVCMNTLICSLLFKATPEEVKIIMVDPKKVELAGYNGLPHLARPVVTNPKKASLVLKEVVNEMERRYSLFAEKGVRNFQQYNEENPDDKICQIVVLIDELADLMMVAAHDVEDSICRLAQMARAAGIHLVIATQRPSVDVITGLIKANVPSRIAFAVSSQIDSRTILDMGGAEKLLGRGDMLFYPSGLPKPLRVQGAYISEKDINALVEYCSNQQEQNFISFPTAEEMGENSEGLSDDVDELFRDAVEQVVVSGQASASSLQRKFRIGYNRAARLIETMEEQQIISKLEGNKRQVLMTIPEFHSRFNGSNEIGINGENNSDDDING